MRHPSPPPSQPESYLLGRWFTAARRQGFFAAIPPTDWHTLSAILSFTSRDGSRFFTLDHLALSLAIPRLEAGQRLQSLANSQWRGQPLATPLSDPEGSVAGAQVAPIELLAQIPGAEAPLPADVPSPAPGDSPGQVEPGQLSAALQQVGLSPEQAEWLMSQFPEGQIRTQLAWLPRRHARNPAAFLLKAVQHNWAAPREGA